MAADPNATPRRDQETRLLLLVLALAVILLTVSGLVYITYQHPALTGPLGVGWTAAAVMVTGLGFTVTRR
ncbi:hypothetical protein [Streptomyces violaceusniger]|uniref:Integral membrane protein n=1 Tax=Streptomyces violaceusniger (strain Tu 4113) TaxID=653045 RepID=G2PGR0_STRV4|nr:hypothetical protein [Streptomyces violaceusniger]AEM88556.1 hypothetical protein Strvi_9271 [Streptomyces violaceusniger Tu 4113]